jgi:acyl carrier protein
MDRQQIEFITNEIISLQLKVNSKMILACASLADYGADHLDRLDIVMKIREKFNIWLKPNYVEDLRTEKIEHLYDEIQSHINVWKK